MRRNFLIELVLDATLVCVGVELKCSHVRRKVAAVASLQRSLLSIPCSPSVSAVRDVSYCIRTHFQGATSTVPGTVLDGLRTGTVRVQYDGHAEPSCR